MSKLIYILLIIFVLFGCKNDPPIDPCNQLVDGVYLYPKKLTDTTMTAEEKVEFWNIPENVLPCLKTDGLLESCLNYPFLSGYMLMAGCCGLQSGYDLMKWHCRGIPELEIRPGALDTIISKYKSIDTINFDTTLNPLFYGGYKYYTYCLEVFLAQEVYLKNATTKQKIELLTDLFVKQNFRKGQPGEYFIEGPTFVMARIMYIDNYQPIVDLYNQDGIVRYLIIYGNSINGSEPKSTIISLAKDYLYLLRSNSN